MSEETQCHVGTNQCERFGMNLNYSSLLVSFYGTRESPWVVTIVGARYDNAFVVLNKILILVVRLLVVDIEICWPGEERKDKGIEM